MKILSEITDSTDNREISSIEYDSRKCRENSLFVAIKGYAFDGHNYIKDAVGNGAKAIVYEEAFNIREMLSLYPTVEFISSKNSRKSLSSISNLFYDCPSKDINITAVTGTNGKTTTAYMLHNLFKEAGQKSALIGTVETIIDDKSIVSARTTPESRDLHCLFSDMRRASVTQAAMEASSHALRLNRCDDIHFDSVIFTNITEDHLDFHNTMEEYLLAKLEAFDILKKSSSKDKLAVINSHCTYIDKILSRIKKLQLPFVTYGTDNSTYNAEIKSLTIKGSVYNLYKENDFICEVSLPSIGKFNVLNSLSVFACALERGYSPSEIKNAVGKTRVPGRFEIVSSSNTPFTVVVDYAHTDDALSNVLSAARNLSPKKIITVFGCGGDRDRNKRPLMGKAAGILSDFVFLTCDNPRTEDIGQIMADTLPGLIESGVKHKVIEERAVAIKEAIDKASEGDLVLIAGKGHEDYQIFCDETIHFDDREVSKEYLSEIGY